MDQFTTQDVSVIVCTKNSINAIRSCLLSLRAAGVGQLIVVDAASTDGTNEIAAELADLVLSDPGTGLGNARNIGIKETTRSLILNMGSDNILPDGQLEKMITYLENGYFHGVAAQTRIAGDDFCSRGLNAWRAGRFNEGDRAVIGTPTLFIGDLLREKPYDPSRKFSDDSELCERWAKEFGARFAISDAYVLEVGKTSWEEVWIRAKMYGTSDHEIFAKNRSQWSFLRKVKSLSHPMHSDFFTPLRHLPPVEAASNIPFLSAFTALRYAGWIASSLAKLNDINSTGNLN